ncbi:hypothetical protein DFJ63DRAFT_310241 [Scheffersomyces coipomensis]|uniref:uncharacterized protein n=1 Tax=Scheffersomyces coipomensis TaxID=1788519 RepID=UPI00315C79C3
MPGRLEESTEDILNSYGSGITSKTLNEEELTTYSMSDESPNKHDLSDLYDLLEDDSIEIRRSTSILESPKFNTSSPEKNSPGKKLRNDYQDFINQMRSPTKKKQTTTTTTPNRNNSTESTFNSYSIRSNTFDNFERNVDKFLNENEIHKIQKSRAELFDLSDDDKTELVIKDTHRVINDLPNNIFGNQEKDIQLKSSINQLIQSIESLKVENKNLKRDQAFLQQKYNNKESAFARVENENKNLMNEKLKLVSEIDRLNRRSDEGSINENANLKRDNTMLTEKLKKYKNLYLKSIKGTGVETKISNSNVSNPLPEIVNLNRQEKEEAVADSDDVNRVLHQLKTILSEYKGDNPSRPSSSSSSSSHIHLSQGQDNKPEIWQNVKDVLQANNQVLMTLADEIDNKKEKEKVPDDNKISPIVIKCFVCHQSQEEEKEKENEVPIKPYRKGICKRCATVNSESSSSASDNDKGNTINVMGEYKWSI